MSTHALSSQAAASPTSLANRLLPTPASPTSNTSCACRRLVASCTTPRSVASSASRPTSGARGRAAPAGRSDRGDGAERLDRLGPALQRDRPERLVADGVAGRGLGGRADDHVAGGAEGLEALRGVHDVAHRGGVAAGAHRAHEHLAAVHADADLHRHLDLFGDLDEGVVHLERGPNGPFGVVFVGDRRAEERHDLVADDLVEPAAEGGDVGDEALETVVDEALDLLGIGARPRSS